MARTIDLMRTRPALAAAMLIAAATVLRLIVMIATPLDIGPDEAQYWRWSQTLDWGYYSKPPLIAWAIAASTSIFGDAEWAVRFMSPVLHGFAAFFLFCLGRSAFSTRVGGWAAVIYLLMPGVWLSSTIMSTDALLLPMWTAALLGFWRLRQSPTIANGALIGLAIGLAMLAKYAALYLFVGAALAAVLDRDMRRALLSLGGVAALAVALLVLAPNLIWNAANGFETVSHTADNVNLAGAGFNISHVASYIGDQMAVFGPITLLTLLAGFALLAARGERDTRVREIWLLCFIAPPLLTILVQEVMSRAHANWAATAYPAASVLLASWIARPRWGAVIKTGLALNLLVGLIFVVFWTNPAIADAAGASNLIKRVRGWDQTATELGQIAREHNATALMFDERENWHGVDYYGRNLDLPPIRAWRVTDHPRSHAELAGTMLPGEDRIVLVVSTTPEARPRIRADFDTIQDLGTLKIPLGPNKTRALKLFLASGYHPLPRTAEYEERFKGQRED